MVRRRPVCRWEQGRVEIVFVCLMRDRDGRGQGCKFLGGCQEHAAAFVRF
jgi:hypothetical protein